MRTRWVGDRRQSAISKCRHVEWLTEWLTVADFRVGACAIAHSRLSDRWCLFQRKSFSTSSCFTCFPLCVGAWALAVVRTGRVGGCLAGAVGVWLAGGCELAWGVALAAPRLPPAPPHSAPRAHRPQHGVRRARSCKVSLLPLILEHARHPTSHCKDTDSHAHCVTQKREEGG